MPPLWRWIVAVQRAVVKEIAQTQASVPLLQFPDPKFKLVTRT